MFYDLDLHFDQKAREKAIQTLQRLGYDVVAFTTTIANATKFPADMLPQGEPQLPSEKAVRPTRFHTDPNFRKKQLVVLERVTIVISHTAQLGLLSSPLLSNFDLVAVRPTTEKLFQQCLSFDIDIVSLSLDRRQHFQLKRPQVHVAAEKGIVFEVPYAAALRDVDSRRFLVSNTGSMCRATKGKHIILSSGARNAMELRGPYDVMNLGVLFDMSPEHSRAAITTLAEDTVAHGDTRANTFKGIVRLEEVDRTDVVASEAQPMES